MGFILMCPRCRRDIEVKTLVRISLPTSKGYRVPYSQSLPTPKPKVKTMKDKLYDHIQTRREKFLMRDVAAHFYTSKDPKDMKRVKSNVSHHLSVLVKEGKVRMLKETMLVPMRGDMHTEAHYYKAVRK